MSLKIKISPFVWLVIAIVLPIVLSNIAMVMYLTVYNRPKIVEPAPRVAKIEFPTPPPEEITVASPSATPKAKKVVISSPSPVKE